MFKRSKIDEWLIQYYEHDNSMLKGCLFDVNIRLFTTNKTYKKQILTLIKYAKKTAKRKYSDYPSLRGISGANLGIPFNFIIVKIGNEYREFINPSYVSSTDAEKVVVRSNCGSINLITPIGVERYNKIIVSYYDVSGQEVKVGMSGPEALTFQHEVDHNKGITIIEKNKEIE